MKQEEDYSTAVSVCDAMGAHVLSIETQQEENNLQPIIIQPTGEDYTCVSDSVLSVFDSILADDLQCCTSF